MNFVVNNDDEAFIQNLWANEECLDLDSIQFGTGEVVLLETPPLIPDSATSIEIRTNGRMSIRDAARLPGVTLSVGLSASAQPPIVIEDMKLIVTGGECAAYGTFGFVAVSRISDNGLVWLAFFLNSNPFDVISRDGGNIIATTNLGAKYVFPLDEPQRVAIVK